jgi:GT2 family glycosyltransferase
MINQVIIPVWSNDAETMAITENTINSLRENDVKLIIVDNGSTLGAGQLKQWADVYIRNEENLGYAKAVNQGLEKARSIVAVANNDIRVSKNWIEVSEEVFKEPKVGSLHFRMIPYDQEFNPGNETWASGKERWCSSSFFVVRNKIRYDEVFKSGVEDWDYWKRFRSLGYKTAYTNKSEYQHLDSFTQKRTVSNEENQTFNKTYFFQKWGKTPEQDFEECFPGELSKPWKPFP